MNTFTPFTRYNRSLVLFFFHLNHAFCMWMHEFMFRPHFFGFLEFLIRLSAASVRYVCIWQMISSLCFSFFCCCCPMTRRIEKKTLKFAWISIQSTIWRRWMQSNWIQACSMFNLLLLRLSLNIHFFHSTRKMISMRCQRSKVNNKKANANLHLSLHLIFTVIISPTTTARCASGMFDDE